jgi:hypothetical protein
MNFRGLLPEVEAKLTDGGPVCVQQVAVIESSFATADCLDAEPGMTASCSLVPS